MEKERNEDDQSTDERTEKAAKGHPKNRASRNRNEKDRRDKLNDCINELASMVPGCSSPSRKLDKATILKNTVDFMKVHNDLTVAITCKDSTSILSSDELGELMLEGSHAFLFVISISGTFEFFSESVQDLLGYSKNELLGENVVEYIHPDDKSVLTKQLTRDSKPGGGNLNAAGSLFILRVKSKLESAENQIYETLRCIGCFRKFDKGAVDEVRSESEDCGESMTSDESCFVVIAEVMFPNRHRNVSNWMNDDVVEFKSRQSMEGKFLYLDPRCIPVIGYLPYELLGTVMYEFIHCDDLQSISKSFESMIDLGEGKTGNYRILTKGCQWIVIQTTNYISYNHWNSKPEFINSTHQLVRNPNNKEADSDVQVQHVPSAAEPDQSRLCEVESSKTGDNLQMSFIPLSNTYV